MFAQPKVAFSEVQVCLLAFRSETLSSELDKAAAALDDALTNSSRLEEELAATAAELDTAVSLSNDLEAQLGSTKEELENSRCVFRPSITSMDPKLNIMNPTACADLEQWQ